jgi:hypothetical protein
LDSTSEGKSRACLEIWCELTAVASLPLRPSVQNAFWKTAARPAVTPCLSIRFQAPVLYSALISDIRADRRHPRGKLASISGFARIMF